MVRSIMHPIMAAALAMFMTCGNEGCLEWTPGASAADEAYRQELTSCSVTAPTKKAACECRLAVDTKYGLCSPAVWPSIGRCEYRCEE